MAYLLILVAGFAPAAQAACELDRLAGQLGANGASSLITAAGTAAPFGLAPGGDCSCCSGESKALMGQAATPAADESLWLPSATPPAPSAVDFVPTLRTAFPGPVDRRHASPPAERAFRRVPRLLI